jgi:Skp family chaperone for outer membrane proteins
MKLFSLPIFVIVFSLAVFAQSIKTAKVNSDAFEDEKTGIKKLVDVLAKLDIEFNPKFDELKLLQGKLKKFAEEIQQKYSGMYEPVRPLNIYEDVAIFEKIQMEFKEKQENANCFYQNRKKELMEPISKRIRVKLAEFNKIKGFAFIYDSADVNSIISNEESIDVTQDFIKFCNEEFEKEKLIK